MEFVDHTDQLAKTHLYVYMTTGLLMIVPDMLVGECLATPRDSTLKRSDLVMARLHMLV